MGHPRHNQKVPMKIVKSQSCIFAILAQGMRGVEKITGICTPAVCEHGEALMLKTFEDAGDPLGAARILIVVDEPGMRHFLVNTLRPISRHVDSAE